MATWDLLQNLTEFDFKSVCSDGTDIYFVQYGGGAEYHVFKYTVATDTVSQISNAASFSGTTPKLMPNTPGGIIGSSIQFFAGNLYAVVFTTDANNLHVYRYDGAGTAWTNVLSTDKGVGALYCTETHLILAPVTAAAIFDWAKYSANGSSWSDATVDTVPAYISTNFPTLNRYSTTYGQEVSPVFIDSSSHAAGFPDPDGPIYRWFEWDGAGTFTITHSTDGSSGSFVPPDAWLQNTIYSRDIFHWLFETSIWKYTENLGDAWIIPTDHFQNGNEIFPIVSINFIGQAGDCAGDFVLLTGSVWGTPETVTGGTGGISHVVKMSDGEGFLFAALGVQAAIYGRSELFPPDDIIPGSATLYYGANNIAQSIPIEVA